MDSGDDPMDEDYEPPSRALLVLADWEFREINQCAALTAALTELKRLLKSNDRLDPRCPCLASTTIESEEYMFQAMSIWLRDAKHTLATVFRVVNKAVFQSEETRERVFEDVRMNGMIQATSQLRLVIVMTIACTGRALERFFYSEHSATHEINSAKGDPAIKLIPYEMMFDLVLSCSQITARALTHGRKEAGLELRTMLVSKPGSWSQYLSGNRATISEYPYRLMPYSELLNELKVLCEHWNELCYHPDIEVHVRLLESRAAEMVNMLQKPEIMDVEIDRREAGDKPGMFFVTKNARTKLATIFCGLHTEIEPMHYLHSIRCSREDAAALELPTQKQICQRIIEWATIRIKAMFLDKCYTRVRTRYMKLLLHVGEGRWHRSSHVMTTHPSHIMQEQRGAKALFEIMERISLYRDMQVIIDGATKVLHEDGDGFVPKEDLAAVVLLCELMYLETMAALSVNWASKHMLFTDELSVNSRMLSKPRKDPIIVHHMRECDVMWEGRLYPCGTIFEALGLWFTIVATKNSYRLEDGLVPGTRLFQVIFGVVFKRLFEPDTIEEERVLTQQQRYLLN